MQAGLLLLSMIRVIFLFGVLCLLEIQHYSVDAIPEPCRGRPVVEDMTEMRFASAAFDLRPIHPIGMIGQIDHAAFANRFIETRPAATAFELGVAPEEGIAAGRTIVGADLMILLQRTAVGPLRSLLPGDIVYVLRQYVLPLIVGQVHRGRVGVRIDRVIDVVFRIHGRYIAM